MILQVFYKILPRAIWAEAVAKGAFKGSGIDLSDGYIHLSTAAQARETAAKHFSGVQDLVLVAVPEEAVTAALKWEASRGGALFPHVYGTINPALVLSVKDLPWNGTTHDFPDGDIA